MRLSFIIPVLNEAVFLSRCRESLLKLKANGHELIVVDGGSQDGSVKLARCFADQVINTPAGRAVQMNAGAYLAQGDILVFLHADTLLPDEADKKILCAVAKNNHLWGGFAVKLSGSQSIFRLVETLMNLRSRITGILTGDQVLFIRRDTFYGIGGFEKIPLMEDIAISKQLKRLGQPAYIRACAVTSSRRWEQRGIVRTVLKMWAMRLAYFLGMSPKILVKYYYGKRG
jgi:rSAM/selenodomain-associated transferase 2